MAKRQIREYVFTPGVAGVGRLKVLDKISLDTILLITNVTKNKILYNFSDPTNQITVVFHPTFDGSDPDFPYASSISNGVTEIEFEFDTTDQDPTDSIQIFVEDQEVTFRPYNFGTDAIERMRVATPQSMLDADFEYGLQPTKWQTVDLMRGYPSIYEVPGTELIITQITSDASSATGGFGDSVITVTTPQAHGLTVGKPVRIVGLNDSIPGVSRALGSFIVDTIPSQTTFTYYAKGRVGTVNGTSLLTSFSHLRGGDFYTGSSIGSPTFSVLTQGSNGSFLSNLVTLSGSNRISFTGAATAVSGAPFSGFGIASGAQITGVTTTSTARTLAADIISPTSTITLNDTSGIAVGAAVNNGIGTASFVNNVVGNTVTLSDPILVNYTGSSDELGTFAGTPLFGNGSGVLFDADRINGRYEVQLSKIEKSSVTGTAGTSLVVLPNILAIRLGQSVVGTGIGVGATVVDIIGISSTVQLSVLNIGTVSGVATFTSIGVGYTTNDRIIINGGIFEGTGPENDIIVRVRSVNATGGITSITSAKPITLNGTPRISTVQSIFGGSSMLLNPTDGTADYLSFASDSEFQFGTGDFTVDFWIYRNRTGVTEILYDMRTSANEVAPLLYISNGTDALRYFVSGSDVITGTTSLSASTWYHVAVSRRGTTTRLFLNGVQEGGNYTDNNNYPQRPVTVGARYDGFNGFFGYIDELRVSKGIARFTSTFVPNNFDFQNDVYNSLYLRFRGLNNTTSFSDDSKGIAISSNKLYDQVAGISTGNGFAANFNVLRIGGASPSYSVTVVNPGTGYAISDTIIIDGSALGGESGTNNLTITVTNVDGTNAITSISFSGTADSGNRSQKVISPSSNSGKNASFNISKNASNYLVSIGNSGGGYYPEYQIKVLGTQLGGNTPTNDLTITTVGLSSTGQTLGVIQGVSVSGTPVVGSAITFFPSVTISEPAVQQIPSGALMSFASIAKVQATFTGNHGLVPGETLLVSINSVGTNHQLAAGPRIVDEIPSLNTLVYNARSTGTINTGTPITGNIYTRPDCFYVHRPFDGGVQLGTGGPAHGAHSIRQSKKYLRYQSGKGIMYTTGTLFAPAYDLRSVTSAGISTGSLITVTTDDNDHGLQIGAEIILGDITTSGYNGNYIVNSIVDENVFTVLATRQLGATTATLGPQAQVSLYKWKGATVRAGAFDDQNGIFWQYDGVNLSVGLRSATYQIAGTISINANSNSVTGSNTRFLDQLIVGDRIVIRGMTHVVTNIASQTFMTVTPDFRGVNNVIGTKAALVKEIIIPQYKWNIDRADGTGPSGYHIEVNKMQMIGFQYTWYGAGFIDWMLRGPNGDYLFVHRLKNNNRNTEAFMRSGNLPVRYEVINEGAKTKLTQNVGIGSTTLFVDDVLLLPDSGSLYINNEIINYTGVGVTNNSISGLTRGATFNNFYSGAQRSYTAGVASTHTAGTGIVLLSNTATPVISHWGSAFLTDGMFDSDRGYIFNYQAVNFNISPFRTTAFLIRLAPSVSNAIVGDLGERELINRAQLLLQGIEFTATGGSANQAVVVEGVLNPQNYPANPESVSWFGLANASSGGQPSFAQIANGTGINWGSGSVFNFTNSVAGPSYTASPTTTRIFVTNANGASVKVGQLLSGTGVPGGTRVRTILASAQFPGNVSVDLTQSIPRPGNVGTSTYTFTDPVAAANPGETVFSFIGSGGGGNTAGLDLSNLKELNNTPIGGRGTFPNGPDVLAINVYTTGGSDFTGSLVLRWGEAQA
jgi:hypothetical protein